MFNRTELRYVALFYTEEQGSVSITAMPVDTPTLYCHYIWRRVHACVGDHRASDAMGRARSRALSLVTLHFLNLP